MGRIVWAVQSNSSSTDVTAFDFIELSKRRAGAICADHLGLVKATHQRRRVTSCFRDSCFRDSGFPPRGRARTSPPTDGIVGVPCSRRGVVAQETPVRPTFAFWTKGRGRHLDNRRNMNAACMSSVPGGRPRTGDFQDVWPKDVLLVKSNIYIGFVRLLKTSLSVARWSF